MEELDLKELIQIFWEKRIQIILVTAIFIVIWCSITFGLLHIFIKNWDIKIFLFISLSFPIILFSIVGLNGESIVYVLKYILKYLIRPKLYLYKKF